MVNGGNRGAFERGQRAAMVVALVMAIAPAALADTVTSKGTVLRGTIKSLSGSGLVLAPEYGKGDLTIAWADIEDVRSDGAFQILYGEDAELDAPLQGFADGKLLVGATAEGAEAIDVATLHSGYPLGAEGLSWRDRVRSSWRYWDGNFDVGFNLQQATTDTTGLLLGFQTIRKHDPLRLIFAANYRYGTEQQRNADSTTTQDQWYGIARAEYDFLPRLYGFASGEATYDAIQRLSIRGIPKVGLGYVFWEDQLDVDRRDFLSGEVGPAWVYERYFGGLDNDYYAIAFALVTGYYLPYQAHFDGRIDYLPAVDNFTTDYLLRSAAALTMPLIDPISAKLSVVDEYDNTPAPDTDRNSLFVAFGLSVAW